MKPSDNEIEMLAAGFSIQHKNGLIRFAHALLDKYAPQASAEDVRNAALEQAARLMEQTGKRIAASDIRALKQPPADKDGCTCPSGDGSLRHPCPAHPGADKDGGQQRAEAAERWRWATATDENAQMLYTIVQDYGGDQQKINERADFYRAALSAPRPNKESGMRERPILFSGPMVRAILAGNKTQTRRIVKPWAPRLGVAAVPADVSYLPDFTCYRATCPYGQPGDRLWVREAFRFAASLDRLSPNDVGEKALDAGYNTPWAPTQFEADGRRTGAWRGFDTPPAVTTPGKLRPGIHMPRWVCRLVLEITSVRVERLQDISYEDARAEGAFDPRMFWGTEFDDIDGESADELARRLQWPQRSFRELWSSINGAGSWDANPWVWVVEFRRADTDKKEM